MRSRPRFHITKHSLDCKIGTLLKTYASLIGGGLPPRVSKLVNVAKYRHFDFETGLDTDTHARRPVFGGGEGGVSKTIQAVEKHVFIRVDG
jgi:hypothetical protein